MKKIRLCQQCHSNYYGNYKLCRLCQGKFPVVEVFGKRGETKMKKFNEAEFYRNEVISYDTQELRDRIKSLVDFAIYIACRQLNPEASLKPDYEINRNEITGKSDLGLRNQIYRDIMKYYQGILDLRN